MVPLPLPLLHIKRQRRGSIATHLISGSRAKQREGRWKQCGNLVNMLRHFAFFLFSLCIAARAVGIIGAALHPMGKRWKQGRRAAHVPRLRPPPPPPPPLRRHQSWQSAAKNPIEVVFHRKWRPFVRARVIGEEGGRRQSGRGTEHLILPACLARGVRAAYQSIRISVTYLYIGNKKH